MFTINHDKTNNITNTNTNDNSNNNINNINNKFRFTNHDQNISQSYPIDMDNLTEIFNLSPPEALPIVTKEDLLSNNNIDVIDENYISILLDYLNNLLKEVPIFQMPPLFNAKNLTFKNKFQKAFTDNILNESQFKYQQHSMPEQQQEMQQQNSAPSSKYETLL